KIFPGRILELETETLIRKQRGQIVEVDLVLGLFRVLEIQRVDFQQRKVALALFRAANMTFDRIAGAQAEAADLRRRDIDVIRAGKIIGIGRAQKSEPV